jgi:hypothetical protein
MTPSKSRFVVCLSNEGYPASLEVRKLYTILHDEAAEQRGMLRIIDESGEDYLYPASWFASLELPDSVARALGAGH